MNDTIIIYTDGSSIGNPGPGGYGVVLTAGTHRKELAQGYRLTTNNRMELMAVIVALETLKRTDCRVLIHTDSQYVAKAVEERWVFQWERKGFRGKKNPDLWQRFLRAYRSQTNVSFVWVKGHAGNPENERCDFLANSSAQGSSLLEDTGYIEEPTTASGPALL